MRNETETPKVGEIVEFRTNQRLANKIATGKVLEVTNYGIVIWTEWNEQIVIGSDHLN